MQNKLANFNPVRYLKYRNQLISKTVCDQELNKTVMNDIHFDCRCVILGDLRNICHQCNVELTLRYLKSLNQRSYFSNFVPWYLRNCKWSRNEIGMDDIHLFKFQFAGQTIMYKSYTISFSLRNSVFRFQSLDKKLCPNAISKLAET